MSAVPQSPTTDFTSTTLNGSINDSVTTVTVNDASTIQAPTYAVIDREDNNGTATPNQREVVKITAVSGNDLTVERGANNSTARSHNDAAKFEPMLTVGFWDDFYDAYDADHTPADGTHDITKVAMLSGTTVQTLANKILSSPTITDPTITGLTLADAVFIGVATGAILSSPTIITPRMTLSQGVSVAPTVEGDIQWRTGDDSLAIGDGTTTQFLNMGQWTSYSASISGFTGSASINNCKYTTIGDSVIYSFHFSGLSVTTNFTASLPYAASASFPQTDYAVKGKDNGTSGSHMAEIVATSSNVWFFPAWTGGSYTASGVKSAQGILIYEKS